jgi:hypothetical protein
MKAQPELRKKAPSPEELVRIYNSAEGALRHDLVLADGSKVTYLVAGGSFGKVAPEIAAQWIQMFPNRISTDKEAIESASRKNADLEAAQKRIEELEALLAAKPAKASKAAKAEALV